MERKDFINPLIILSLGLSSCAKEPKPAVAPITPTIAPAAEFIPTYPPFPTEIPSPTPEKEKAIEDLFKLGSFDTTKPFTIVAEEKLRRFLGHTDDLTLVYSLDFPLVVKTTDLSEADPKGRWNDIYHHADGFAAFVFTTDIDIPGETQAVLIYGHTLMENPDTVSIGNLAYEVGAFAYNNPEKVGGLYENTVKIEYEGKVVDAGIVYAVTLPSAYWLGDVNDGPFDSNNKYQVPSVKTDHFFLPKPSKPGMVQLIFLSCQSKVVGRASLLHSENTVNISIVILEFERPN